MADAHTTGIAEEMLMRMRQAPIQNVETGEQAIQADVSSSSTGPTEKSDVSSSSRVGSTSKDDEELYGRHEDMKPAGVLPPETEEGNSLIADRADSTVRRMKRSSIAAREKLVAPIARKSEKEVDEREKVAKRN